MKAQQRRTRFDTRSVMLFAALSLGGAAALQAQAQTPPPSPQFGPAGKSASQTSSEFSSGPGSNSPGLASVAAFDRADSNKDGQLSDKEVEKLPAIGQRFKELDADGNGSLSRQEFEKGANS